MESSGDSVDTHGPSPTLIIEALPVGLLEVNCYLVICPETSDALVVDPGADAGRIMARVREMGVRVIRIAHTHGHFDHISATEELCALLPIRPPVAAHPADMYLYDRRARAMGTVYGYALPEELMVPSEPLADRAELAVGPARLEVIHTPGHTPGSICLHWLGHWLISGDTLFHNGIGRTDLPGGEEDAIYESILTRLYSLPDDLVVYPGHGPATTVGAERRGNPFVQAQDG